ncbi:MAG TPA: hypothetical protein VFP97_15020 [Chitinophagaceae bacterium]|nr:hypothetical protein [Chitinophagaceae bacterium]
MLLLTSFSLIVHLFILCSCSLAQKKTVCANHTLFIAETIESCQRPLKFDTPGGSSSGLMPAANIKMVMALVV